MSFFSTTLTPSTVIQSLMANKPNLRQAIQFVVVVRSMGTATYVGLGGLDTQDRRLSTVGDGMSLSADFNRPQLKKWLDPTQIFVSSDTSDAVIEIFGETP